MKIIQIIFLKFIFSIFQNTLYLTTTQEYNDLVYKDIIDYKDIINIYKSYLKNSKYVIIKIMSTNFDVSYHQ